MNTKMLRYVCFVVTSLIAIFSMNSPSYQYLIGNTMICGMNCLICTVCFNDWNEK
jgi:hypothetical protein